MAVMDKQFIFVSCGQWTPEEKSLGKDIVSLIKRTTGLDAFFAEGVQDLNGLDSNILEALHDCSAFITIMHPRGEIKRPDGSTLVRASVWIEQEVAIATYIQRIQKKTIPVIAFIHESVGLEGLRALLNLNPIRFANNKEVLAALPERLSQLRVAERPIRVELTDGIRSHQQGHWIRQLVIVLVNDTNQRITSFNCKVRLPAGLLKHWSQGYLAEVKSDDDRYRCFSIDERRIKGVTPRSTVQLLSIEYCPQCAVEQSGEPPELARLFVGNSRVEATVWIDGKEYSAAKTVQELTLEPLRSVYKGAEEALGGLG